MRCVEQSAILFKVLFNYIAIVYLSVLDKTADSFRRMLLKCVNFSLKIETATKRKILFFSSVFNICSNKNFRNNGDPDSGEVGIEFSESVKIS